MYPYLWTLKLKNMSISPYSFPGLKLDQKDKQQIKNNTKLLRYKITKEEILENQAVEKAGKKKVKPVEPVDLLKEEEIVTKDNKKIHLNRFDLFDEDE